MGVQDNFHCDLCPEHPVDVWGLGRPCRGCCMCRHVLKLPRLLQLYT